MSQVLQGYVGGGIVLQGYASGTESPDGREDDIYRDIGARLAALGCFEKVIVYKRGGSVATSDSYPFATVLPGTATDRDNVDAVMVEVRSTYEVVVTVRAVDEHERARAIGRLVNRVRNALNRKSLAGLTLPGWTSILRHVATPDDGSEEASATITAEWAYLVPEDAEFNTAE